jgi:Zn-dependent protease
MFVLIVSVSIHELAHAKSAEAAGDDTARKAGRISLNPLDHLDPMGTIMMVVTALAGFGIGWAKPVPVNPMKFRSPRWDSLKVSLWGPLSNIMIATLAALVIRIGARHLGAIDIEIALSFVMINVALAMFNMLPIAPLDGSHIMSSLLPTDLARSYDAFMGRYGFMILLALIMAPSLVHFDILGTILWEPTKTLVDLLVGSPLL